MSELSPEARAILLAGRDGDEPSPADRARLRRSLAAAIGAGELTGTGAEGTAEAAAVKLGAAAGAAKVTSLTKLGALISLGGATWAWKGALALLAAGAVTAGVIAGPAMMHVEGPTPAASIALPPAPPAPLEPKVTPIGPADPPVEPAPAPPAPPQQTTPPAPMAPSNAPESAPSDAPESAPADAPESAPSNAPESADTLLAETRRLRAAHGALQGGDPARALALLSEPSASTEGQSLQEERAAARVLALCELGRGEEARAEAARFLAQNPGSPLADRVRNACSRETDKP